MDAADYLSRISEKQQVITTESMGYISAVAHGKSARKVEKQRTELINAVLQARATAKNLQPFEGDTALKSAAYNYFNLTYIIFKEDYAKIMDMEEIAEQSYDNMEAYLTAQDLANEKLEEAEGKVQQEFKAFAARHKVNLIEEETSLDKMADKVNKTNKYYHDVFLVFFKSYHTELYLLKAIGKKDVNGLEQNKNSLIKSTEEDLGKLSKMTAFDGDGSLLSACKALLQFYQNEAKNKMQLATDYFVKEANFAKTKKVIDGGTRNQSDIDAYNKAVDEVNKAVNVYNKASKELDEGRHKAIMDWNNATEAFLSKHTPTYNK
jgi:hypothetical protein